ncbi:hypothetical protein Tco_1019512 [Tanacetum coccineum]|uniref:Uncharacterized protein n=1 Tax=Tanacetum coccineum TaxID=301880 RepID=A0ABQ5FZP4_9ASTR
MGYYGIAKTTTKVKTVNEEVQIQDLVDKKKLTLMGAKTNAWNEFSSTMASTVICHAINQKFNFSKYIFDNMVKNLEGGVKFLMYPRVLDLEKTKTSQAAEITGLKKRVKKLEGKRKSKPPGMKRLFKIGRSAQVVSSEDEGLGDQEDASKQGRKIADIDADAEDMVEKEVSTAEVTTDSATTTTVDELTLAQTLIEIKAAKPKARGVIVQELSEFTTTTSPSQPSQLPQAKDKGKAKTRYKIKAEEQGELTIKEKSRLFMELMNKRKKHFARLRAEEQRRKPPTKAQKRNTMSTYLKNMVGYKHNQLKTKSFEDIQMLFDKEMKRVNTFVDMDTELVKGSETRIEGSSKRAGEELESENLKKQKLDENVEAEVDDDQEEAEMKKHMEIVPDDEVAIDAIPLATKPPIIIDWKIIKEGKMGYFQIIRADGSSKRYSSMIKMLQNIDREDLETLWKLVKAKHGLTRPEEAYERVLWGDLKVMFEPDVESEVWRNLQGHKVTVWKLFSSSGVHFMRLQTPAYSLFASSIRRYPLLPVTITINAQHEALLTHRIETVLSTCLAHYKIVTNL